MQIARASVHIVHNGCFNSVDVGKQDLVSEVKVDTAGSIHKVSRCAMRKLILFQ